MSISGKEQPAKDKWCFEYHLSKWNDEGILEFVKIVKVIRVNSKSTYDWMEKKYGPSTLMFFELNNSYPAV